MFESQFYVADHCPDTIKINILPAVSAVQKGFYFAFRAKLSYSLFYVHSGLTPTAHSVPGKPFALCVVFVCVCANGVR